VLGRAAAQCSAARCLAHAPASGVDDCRLPGRLEKGDCSSNVENLEGRGFNLPMLFVRAKLQLLVLEPGRR
jgi:hypothetical protein